MINTILFDLSDVLIKGMEGSEIALSTKLKLPMKQVCDELFSFNFHPFWTNKWNEKQCFSKLIETYGWNISYEDLSNIIRSNFHEIPGTRELIQDLKNRYKVILLSVNPREWVEYIESKFDYRQLFDAIDYSYEIGFTKREPEAFVYILEKYGKKPGEVLFIDDSSRNLGVAAILGIQGIKFRSAIDVRRKLKKMKLL